MEIPNGTKTNEECHYLLKMETVDTITRRPPPVGRDLKRVIQDNWPKILSGYWMAMAVLMALSLIVYSLSIGWYSKPPSLLIDTQFYEHATNDRIFFHHLVPIGFPPAFAVYSEFLNTMAQNYPSLELNICFLIDDSTIRLTDDMWPKKYTYDPLGSYNSRNKWDWQTFESKHENVKVSYTRLSNFMVKTPLRHYWRSVPLPYLPFYARIFSVWKQGGIGMDLIAYNNRFSKNFDVDRRLRAIMKNHNDHTETNYNVLLKAIDDEEERNCFIRFSNSIIDETVKILNNLIPFAMAQDINTLLLPIFNASSTANDLTKYIDKPNNSDTTKNTTMDGNSVIHEKLNDSTNSLPLNANVEDLTTVPNYELDQPKDTMAREGVLHVNETQGMNKSDFEGPHVFFFYEVSLLANNNDQPKFPAVMSSPTEDDASKRKDVARLALNSDGTFVAATQKRHRFLELLLNDSVHKIRPDFAIKRILQTRCSDTANVFRNEQYCSIYHLGKA